MRDAKYYGLSQDAGNRQHLEHLIKTVTYPRIGADGKRYLENICINVDVCGKTAEEVACNIENSLNRFKQHTPAKCICITGDAGGGGAVQTIFPLLVAQGVFLDEEWAQFIRCLLHALNKCLERAIIKSMGEAGLGKNSCIQLL